MPVEIDPFLFINQRDEKHPSRTHHSEEASRTENREPFVIADSINTVDEKENKEQGEHENTGHFLSLDSG